MPTTEPCSPTIPCTSVSTIYRSTVSSIHTAPASSPQRILFIVSRTQQLRCDSSSLGMCCFLSVCSQSLVLYSSIHLHCVSLVIVLYAALCTVALAHCASYRLPPSLPSLSLSSRLFSLFQTTVIITLQTALRRGEHIRVNPFCLAALMFVAMICWSINTHRYTRGSEKREPQMRFLSHDLFILSFSTGLINMGQSSAVVIVSDLTC